MARLLTLDEAAAELGIPRGSLRTAAQGHGLLVKMGRAVRIDPSDLPELIEKCRTQPKEPEFTAVRAESGSSVTPSEGTARRALETAERLKGLSRGTSRKGTDRVVPLPRTP